MLRSTEQSGYALTEKGMRESNIEGLAIHGGPESWKAPDNRHEEGNGRVLR